MAEHGPATVDSWKTEPFGEIGIIPYAAAFSAEEVVKLRAGFVPAAMEDKWFIYYDEPSLLFHRSWTGQAVYRVDFVPGGSGSWRVAQAFCAADVLQKTGGPEYQAKLLTFLIGNILLGRSDPFPLPAGAEQAGSGVYQHVVSGTGYPEERSEPDKVARKSAD